LVSPFWRKGGNNMNTLMQVMLATICLFIAWRLYKVLKANPDLLKGENMSKSLTTMGILALILIGGIAFLVMIVRVGS